ncbi:RNA-binding motif, single-stranded-interacting protein 1 isoform X1 [Lates japonicus]|uniref:RNA-binding motif, single-stranded-interacting protein 1 isoform X1 n=1 Tax=Lates japonicus TaxID=270547 RepID=A0AAD3MKS4_LATJO|nr:RNA-binding motif, single-stranded-interacting protein 1 isoform X1 [Lates japonicus]
MFGMCGRQQHERRRVFSPTDCAPTNRAQKHFVSDYKLSREHQTPQRAFVAKNKPPVRIFTTRPRSLFDVKHPAEAEMVWSVVGGTAERSAAGRRRSMNRTGGLVHRLACI